MAASLLTARLSSMNLLLTVLLLHVTSIDGHGYLKTPRSRNLHAYLERDWEDGGGNSPYPEDCPHCLNRGGSRSQCGLLEGIDQYQNPWIRNYDAPLNYRGQRLPPSIQQTYVEGQIITVEVMVTTHHKGHFEFRACPLVALDETTQHNNPLPIPTQECFDSYPLKFVSDTLYGAPPDPDYPERAYIAPAQIPQWSPGEGPDGTDGVVGALYTLELELPKGLNGEVVLLQWYYLTANSCKHEGYSEYNFPESWGSDVKNYEQMEDCGEVPPDGDGVPEQFWNCGEVKIERSSDTSPSFQDSWYKSSEEAQQQQQPSSSIDTMPDYGGRDYDEESGHEYIAEITQEDEPEEEEVLELVVEDVVEELLTTDDTTTTPPPEPVGPCSDAAFFGYEPNDDCSGYYWCQGGTIIEEVLCAGGTLYDKGKQMCTWADEVRCAGAAASLLPPGETLPPVPPTPSPTQRPNPLLEWDRSKKKRKHDKTIIGYYASWQWYDRDGLAAPINMDFSKITRANFAFFQITEDGYIFGTDSWADPITLFGFYDWMAEPGTGHQYCSWDGPNEEPKCGHHHYEEGLIYLAHQAGAEVYPSIGGWSLSDPFPVMAANPEYRANFVRQCIQLIRSYNFDGIDIDWEYPGYEPHSGTPEDGVSWNLLLDDLRVALDELEQETGHYYGITAALPCGPSIIDNQDIAHVGKMLTELNLMTYDFHGTWGDIVGVNAPLYDQKDSEMMSVHGCMENWVKGGAPKEKINIGFPFYGRSFLGAKHLYEEFGGAADESMWHEDEGCPQYFNIIKKFGKLTSYRDEQTMTQVAYASSGVVSYDDPRAICDKTQYAMEHGLNGYIIWELSGDMLPDKSTPLLDAANKKLEDPSIDCATMSDDDALISKITPQNVGPLKWYPLHDGSNSCTADGNQPSYYQNSDLFDSEIDCCDKHFSWTDSCVSEVVEASLNDDVEADAVISIQMFYPLFDGAGTCIKDGNQPSYYSESDMFHSAEDCCKKYFEWNADCINESATLSTVAPFAKPEGNPGISHVVDFSPYVHSKVDFDADDKEEVANEVSANEESGGLSAKLDDDGNKDDETVITTSTTAAETTTYATSTTTSNISIEWLEPPTPQPITQHPVSNQPISPQPITPKPVTTQPTTAEPVTPQPVSQAPTSASPVSPDRVEPAITETTTTATTTSTTTTSSTTKRGPSYADGFVSSSEQFASYVHAKDSDEEPKKDQSYASSYSFSEAINHKKDDNEEGKDEPKPQSYQAEEEDARPQNDKPLPQANEAKYALPITFDADLLPFRSGHALEVRNPTQMAKAILKYLKNYFDSLQNQSFANTLTNFELECGRTKEKEGTTVYLKFHCEGEAVFNAWPPSSQEFIGLVLKAFRGRNHDKFLQSMYPTYKSELGEDGDEGKESSTLSIAEKIAIQFPQDSTRDSKQDNEVNEIKQAKKDAIKLKRLGQVPGKRNMLRKR